MISESDIKGWTCQMKNGEKHFTSLTHGLAKEWKMKVCVGSVVAMKQCGGKG